MVLNINFFVLTISCLIVALGKVFFSSLSTLGLMCFVSAFFVGILIKKKKLSIIDFAFVCAFLMNVWYVLFSFGNIRQYDYYNFVMFADYLVKNDFFVHHAGDYLKSVYFHPPLWGFLSAFVTKFTMLMGHTQDFGFDCSRFISLWAVGGTYIIFWRFINLLQFKLHLQIGLFVLFLFAPINGIMANLVNNDALVYFLMWAGLYVSYVWYQKQTYRLAVILSILLFLAGMTKFSGLMIVPYIGVLGLFLIIDAQNKFKKSMWGQFFIIATGAVLGFTWGIFLLYFDFPLVPPPIGVNFQDMSHYTLAERLFSLSQIGIPFADIRSNSLEPNVWLVLIKTSLFGEWKWEPLFWVNVLYSIGLFWAVVSVYAFFLLPTYRLGKNFALNAAIIVLVFSVFVAWISFWLEYPYFCSSEFRYIIILLPVSLLWIGAYLNQQSLPKAVNVLLAGLVGLMIISRFMLYLNTI